MPWSQNLPIWVTLAVTQHLCADVNIFVLGRNQGNKLLLSKTPDLTFTPDPPLVSTKGEKVKFERAPKVRSRFKGPHCRGGGTRPRCQRAAAGGSPEGLDGAFVSTAACGCRMGPYGQSVTSNTPRRASLVAQWLRICLLMQGTRVRALVWEDPTCHGAAGPVSHNC